MYMRIIDDFRFWNKIMIDHSIFILNSLSVSETEYLEKANYFYNAFSNQYNSLIESQISEIEIRSIKELVYSFIDFKKLLLKDLLSCNLKITQTPTFINHMINEALEYYRILSIYDNSIKIDVDCENLRLHKIWLADASGHANFIASQLDNIEELLKKEALNFREVFNSLFIEAFELAKMFERIQLENNNVILFNQKVKLIMESFINFLNELIVLKGECKLLTTGTFDKSVPEHMKNESEYYLKIIEHYLKEQNR